MADDTRRRRLLYRASHRGIKEMDLLFGDYVRQHVGELDEHNLDLLEQLLDVPDQQLYAWITDAEPVPADFDNPQFLLLKEYSYAARRRD